MTKNSFPILSSNFDVNTLKKSKIKVDSFSKLLLSKESSFIILLKIVSLVNSNNKLRNLFDESFFEFFIELSKQFK